MVKENPTLIVARTVSLYLMFPGWVAAGILLFVEKSPAAAGEMFRLAFLFLAMLPAAYNIVLTTVMGFMKTNDSVAECKIVGMAALGSLVPPVLVLPADYWLAHLLLGLMVANRIVNEIRLRTLNPEHKVFVSSSARTVAPVATSSDAMTDDEENAPDSFSYPAEQAEHSLNDLAGMEDIKAKLLATAKEARQMAGEGNKGGGLRANSRNGILLYGEPGNGKTVFAEGLAGSLKLPIIKMSFGNVASKWLYSTTENVVTLFREARAQAPCVLFMDEVDSVIASRDFASTTSEEGPKTTNQMLTELVATRGTGVIIMMATNFFDRLDTAAIREGRVDFKIQLPPPDAAARRAIITHTLTRAGNAVACQPAALEQAVKRWEGFSAARIRSVVDQAVRHAEKSKKKQIVYTDLQQALRVMQGAHGERISESTPTLDQMHMPEQQRAALTGIAKRMIAIEEIERIGGTVPTGVLLAGPPGTGKTFAVRVLAKTTHWPLLTSTGADLMADSKNIDQLISKARNARPCIVFIDEADDVFSDRRSGSNYSAAITNKLLTAIDGVGGKLHDILWVAAVNAPETMDSAALRGGRFTEKVWFENPDANTAERIIEQWLTKSKAKFARNLTAAHMADMLDGESPANIQAILQQAVNTMIGRAIEGKGEQIVQLRDLDTARTAVSV